MMMNFLVQDFSVPIYPNFTNLGIHIPCMNLQGIIFFLNLSAFSFNSVFLLILWDLENFRVRGVLGGYTFYVRLRSILACSLEITWNKHYQKFLGKILKFHCFIELRIFRQWYLHKVCILFLLVGIQILHTACSWFQMTFTKKKLIKFI